MREGVFRITPEELYLENQNLVRYVINRCYPMHQFDDDILQEGRIGLWKACLAYDADTNIKFSTYAFKCIYNAIGMALRSIMKQPPTVSLYAPISEYDGTETYLEDVLAGEMGIDLPEYDYLMQDFSKLERKMCELKLLGLSQADIARKLGYSRANVCRTFKRIQKKLLEKLEEN